MNSATLMPLLKGFFHEENDLVLILDTNCKIKEINDKAARMLNLGEEVGKLLRMDEVSKCRWISFLKKIQQDHYSFSSFNIQGKDTSYKEIKVFGIYIDREKLIYLKIMNEALNHEFYDSNYTFINDLSNGVVFLKNEIVIGMNSKASELLNVQKEDMVDTSLEIFLTKLNDFNFERLNFLSNLRNYGQASIIVSQVLNEEEIFLKLDCKYNYHLNMLVMTIVDKTETMQLKKKVEELKQLSAMGQMAASIVHEIRNPMTSLKGFVELLKGSSIEESNKYLQVMESEIGRMETILSEILYLAKPAEHHEEIVSISNVVKEVIQIMQPQAYSNGIMFNLKMDMEKLNTIILGNSNRLKQLFINLVRNAIEVMTTGGTITIELKNIGNAIQVSVEDEGVGIPEESLNKLFTPFFTTKENGTGLGLALVKKVVEEHRGKVRVSSIVNKGSTFILEFPNYTEGFTRYYYNETQIKKWMMRNENNSFSFM